MLAAWSRTQHVHTRVFACGRIQHQHGRQSAKSHLGHTRRAHALCCLQTATDWGWTLADAIEYVSIATLYGCEYGFRQGQTKGDVFGIAQPDNPKKIGIDGVDFSGEYVRVVTGILS
jgi:hypothetical protein